MSKKTNEESLPKSPPSRGDEASPKPKRAAKKAAVKAESPTAVAIKTPTKKVAAKKAARKAVSEQPELPSIAAALPPPATKATRAPRAKKVAPDIGTIESSSPNAAPAPEVKQVTTSKSAADESTRRFGRVPGGGPVREPQEPRPAPTAASIPFPSSPPTPPTGPIPPPNRENNPQARLAKDGQPQEAQQRENQPPRDGQGPPRESRSKRRREKRKRGNSERYENQGNQGNQGPPQSHQNHQTRHRAEGQPHHPGGHEHEERRPIQLSGPKVEINGMLELAPKGFGFLRVPGKNFEQARDDVFVTPESIRKYNLRLGQWIHGVYQEGPRGPQLAEISLVNDMAPEDAAKLPHFDELKAINPGKRISFESTPERFTTRVVDIMSPVGRGQRGLIVSPPRSGKTTLLLHMAEAIREKYDEAIHLMVVLVDERPEEVTEFRRALPGAEIYASSNDEQARSHTRIAELAIERAKRLVEAGKDVFLIMDSITRLARAYNGNMNNRGRGTGSGGLTIGSLEIPRRLFAAARNTRGGGSLTIMATALIQTNSRADEAIYMEFKGTGNMELVLDRKIAENYIYPAVDIFKSGTRREELLLADHMLHKIHLIRRGLSGHRPAEAMERLLFFLKKFPNNPQMLLEIKG